MRTLTELIDNTDPAWRVVEGWIRDATRSVEVVPRDAARAEQTLLALQITTRSPMGAIAYESAGITIDQSWLRILGSGGARMDGIARWNGLGESPLVDPIGGALLVAHDAVGGFFAVDGGAFGEGKGSVFYFAPDALEWEDTERNYSGFVQWAMRGDLDSFYENARWPGWQEEVSAMSLDRGMSTYPPLWSAEYAASSATRRPGPIAELLRLQMDIAQQRFLAPA